MTRLLKLAPLLLCALAFGCGPVFYVQAEEPKICKTLYGQAVPADLDGASETFSQDYDYDFGDKLLDFGDKKVTTEIRALGVTFTAENLDDIHFIQSGVIKLTDPAGNLPEITILSYDKGSDTSTGATLQVQGGDTIDITQYLNAGTIHVHADLTGVFPSKDWKMDVKACLYTKVEYDYL